MWVFLHSQFYFFVFHSQAEVAEKQRIEFEIFTRRMKAAIMIQKIYKGWICRKKLKEAKNPKGKGKGKPAKPKGKK